MSKQDLFEIKDRSILTLVEHRLIGSTVDRQDMIDNPHTPQAILDGRRVDEVNRARQVQREIVSMDVGSFGLGVEEMPIVALSHLDEKTGLVEDRDVKLSGIYGFYTQRVTRDPATLLKHQLTAEGKKKFLVEGETMRIKSSREGEVA